MKKQVLIVGGSGFLGRAIVHACVQKDWQVTATYQQHRPQPIDQVTFISTGQIDPHTHFDYIFLAAGNYQLSQTQLIAVNVTLTQKLSQQFPQAKLIFISSVAVYGTHKRKITLDSDFKRPNFYGLAKLAGEAVAQTHAHFAILRLTYLYGPGLNSSSFLPTIIKQAKKGTIILRNRGERLQDYLQVNDAARLCVAAAQNRSNGVYLGATGKSLSNRQVAELIKHYLPQTKIRYVGSDTVTSFRFDVAETKKKLNWQAQQQFKKAIGDLL